MSASSAKPLNVQLPAITLILFALCVGIFCYLAQWMSYEEVDQSALIHLGANVASLTLSGESWRLLSSVFLHSSVSHLLMNMFALLVVGGVVDGAGKTITFRNAPEARFEMDLEVTGQVKARLTPAVVATHRSALRLFTRKLMMILISKSTRRICALTFIARPARAVSTLTVPNLRCVLPTSQPGS